MPSFNCVIIMGNLTRDPEVRYTPKGTPVCDLGIAINRTFNDASGQKQEEVTFVDVTAWDKRAETISQYFKKGDPIHVRGRLSTEQWEDKQSGQKRSKLKVILEEFSFVKSGNGDGAQRPAAKPSSRPAPQQRQEPEGYEDEDNIPF